MVAAMGTAQASLFDRGGGLIYDDVLNITWLQDANYAKTSGFDSDGLMHWGVANQWAENLSYGGWEDWRLPTALRQDGSGPCVGYCTDSEMGHMFYNNFVASPGTSILTGTNYFTRAMFSNLQSFLYWSGTTTPDGSAWYFKTDGGYQNNYHMGRSYYAWAVRDGDVAVSPVPAPPAFILMLTGLGVLGLTKRFRKADKQA